MNGPEKLAFLKAAGAEASAEQMIEALTNRLLEALYIPSQREDGRLLFGVDKLRTERFGIEDEAINWGDLKCSDVKALRDGRYIVVIDEAAPDECPTLCDYVRRHLLMHGWDCEVETEW